MGRLDLCALDGVGVGGGKITISGLGMYALACSFHCVAVKCPGSHVRSVVQCDKKVACSYQRPACPLAAPRRNISGRVRRCRNREPVLGWPKVPDWLVLRATCSLGVCEVSPSTTITCTVRGFLLLTFQAARVPESCSLGRRQGFQRCFLLNLNILTSVLHDLRLHHNM